MSDTAFDEFSFLPDQAAEAGVTPLPPVRRLAVSVGDSRTISALQYGAPGATDFADPVVTFLHGAGLNAHTWDTTVLGLGLPALAIDLPGHGDSAWRTDVDYSARTLAADVALAIAEWTTTPQLLVGQSLGGLTAAAVTAAHPELVRELVIIDITPGIDPNGGAAQIRQFFAGPTNWATRDELVDRALAFGLGGSREAAARGVYLNSRVRDDGRIEWKHHFAHLANMLAANPSAAAASEAQQDAAAGLLSAAGWEDLASVTAPITLLRGEHGYVTAADAADFARRLPSASVDVVPTGHNVQEEIPIELGRRLSGLVGNG